MSSTNIQIAVKIRPLIERELKEKIEALWVIRENSVVQVDYAQNCYSFDHIFDDHKTNKHVYDSVVNPLVISCLHGINSTIFAYGQTSSGKTHTMLGDKDNPGIINYAIEDIFKYVEENSTKNFLLRCSYLEIYNEKINDLLDAHVKDIKIREDCYQGVHVAVREEVIREKDELFSLMKRGMKIRKIGCTDMNERSSRSHTIFKLIIQAQDKDSEGSYTESSLSLVDLAGSERVGQMNLKGERQAEGVLINKSLTTLGLVIRKLSENEQFINYRDSKLTRLLQHSLGGNSKTLIICTITPAALDETKSTLEFAQRAKYVKNRPVINEKVTDKDQLKQYARLCQDYKEQIDQLSLERLEKEKTINALQGKIHNIELFSAGTFEKDLKINKPLPRRHTMGHYKPSLKTSVIQFQSGILYGLDESSDEDISSKQNVTEKCDRLSHLTSDEKPTCYSDRPHSTPSKVLRAQKELLEESYESLRSFTNYERQFSSQCDEIKELRDLTNRLRDENISLSQQIIKERETKINAMETHREVYENLTFLKGVLEGNSSVGTPRKSLQTIVEEEQLDTLSDESDVIQVQEWLRGTVDPVVLESDKNADYQTLLEENFKLKNQLEEINNTVKEKDIKEAELSNITCALEKKLHEKESCIESLKLSINQEKDTKEAELDILNNKLKKLNSYKEEMHKKLSEIQQDNENLIRKEEFDIVNSKNVKLEMQFDNLQKEFKSLQQLNETNLLQIRELKQENQMYKIDLEAKNNLEMQLEAFRESSELLEEARKEISDLRQVVRTEAKAATSFEDQLLELKVKYSEMETQQQIIDKKNIELEKQLNNAINENNVLQAELKLLKSVESDLNELRDKNSNFKDKIDELQKENNQLKETLTLSTSNLYKQQTLNLELQNKISDYLTDISNLKEVSVEFNRLKEEFNEKSIEHNNLLKSIEGILTEKQQVLDKYNILESEKDDITKHLSEAKLLNDVKTEENESLNHELNKLKERAMEIEKKECDYERYSTNLEKEISSVRGECDQKLVDLNTQLEHLEEENADLKRNISILDSQVYDLMSQNVKKLMEEKEVATNALTSLREELQQVNVLKNKVETENNRIEKESEHLQECIALKIREYDELKSQFSQLSNLQEENLRLRDILAKTNDDCKTHVELNTNLQNQISELTSEVTALSKQNENIQKIEEEKDAIQNELITIKEQMQKTNELRNNVEAEKSHILKENENLKDCIDSRNKELKQLNEQLCILDSENNNLKRALSDVTLKCDSIKTNYETKLEQLNDDLSAVDELKVVNAGLQGQLSNLTEEISYVKKENAELISLGKISEEKVAENITLKDSLLIIDGENVKLQQLNKKLEEEKDAMLKNIAMLKTHINERDMQINKLNEEIEKNMRRNECIKLETLNLQKENEQLKCAVTQTTEHKDREVIKLTEQIHKLTVDCDAKINKLNNVILTMQNKVICLEESLSLKITEYTEMVQHKDEEIIELTSELGNLKVDYDSKIKDMEIIKLTSELSNLKAEYESKIKELTDIIAVMQNKVSNLQESLRLKTADFTNGQTLISSLKKKIRNLDDEIGKLNKSLESQSKLLTNKNVLITNLKKEELKHKEEKTDLEKQHSRLLKENFALQERNQKNLNQIRELQDEHSLLESKNKEQNRLLAIIEGLKQKLEEKENQCKLFEGQFNMKIKANGLDESSRKKVTDGIFKEKHISRLSDESRPLSPNEIRKIKRQSIHDQHRGLDLSSSESIEFSVSDCVSLEDDSRPASVNDQIENQNEKTECIYCKSLQLLVKKIKEEKEILSKEVQELTEKNVVLDDENEDMLKVIRGLEEQQCELFEELQSHLDSKGAEETNQFKAQVDLLRENEELENKLLEEEKVIKTYKDQIVDLQCNALQLEHKHESIEKDLRAKISELQYKIRKTPISVCDKETQATCDIHEKYKTAKSVAIWRKKEGDYLRAKLNLPPNCPVLPEDIQRCLEQPK